MISINPSPAFCYGTKCSRMNIMKKIMSWILLRFMVWVCSRLRQFIPILHSPSTQGWMQQYVCVGEYCVTTTTRTWLLEMATLRFNPKGSLIFLSSFTPMDVQCILSVSCLRAIDVFLCPTLFHIPMSKSFHCIISESKFNEPFSPFPSQRTLLTSLQRKRIFKSLSLRMHAFWPGIQSWQTKRGISQS